MKFPCIIIMNGRPYIHGWVIGSVNSHTGYDHARLGQSRSYVFEEGYVSKALVLLETFSKGDVVELSWFKVRIADSIEQAKQWCNDSR